MIGPKTGEAYNIRAVMDALVLAGPETMTTKDVFEMVNGKIDVEKEPTAPLEKMVDMVSKLKG